MPDTVEAMAADAVTFIRALGYEQVDIFAFSFGGMIAQALVLEHPDLVRRLVLTGTGPKGGKDMDKVARTTYYDIVRATLTPRTRRSSCSSIATRPASRRPKPSSAAWRSAPPTATATSRSVPSAPS